MTPRVSGLMRRDGPRDAALAGSGLPQRPINFVIITSDSYQNLSQVVRASRTNWPESRACFSVQVDTDLPTEQTEIRLEVDRERAADMGIGVDAIARSVETMLGGRIVTTTSARASSTT